MRLKPPSRAEARADQSSGAMMHSSGELTSVRR
jgi:hypothetical protein